MPRKGPVARRIPRPDVVYGSRLVSRLINQIMRRGKKSTAERIVYGAMDEIASRSGRDPLEVYEQALRKVIPELEVKPRRVGGATYQVPMEVRPTRRLALGLRWLVTSTRARSGRTMQEKLAAELQEAAAGQGASVKKREDTHRMAEANRAFAHYRW
ncbi:MAG TPA: 30S ribosomal protein S7 [Armatimonadota bacterium]|nr:30S ribosomal protein S7 [Armatimonadota bacterium]